MNIKARSFLAKASDTFQRHTRIIVMDIGNCSETDIEEPNTLTASEIHFPWGHGARRFVSMAPVFLSVVLILARKILKVDKGG